MTLVATAGTVKATASVDTVDNSKADTGMWTAGEVAETADPKLAVGSAAVLHQAICVFTFAGTKGNTPVADSSKVTLSPKQTTLESGQTAVLLDGDSASDSFGNMLAVQVPKDSKLSSSAK
jgi:hypothetical protein